MSTISQMRALVLGETLHKTKFQVHSKIWYHTMEPTYDNF